MLEYRSLEAFATVIERGGFEKAARALSLTQSAVSQRIRQLEQELGEVLVVREIPPRPTVAGIRLLQHWRQVRDLEAELRSDFAPLDDQGYHQITIGVHTDSLALWFMDAIIPFMASQRVTLEILQDEQDRVIDFLREGVASACISPQADAIQGCSVKALGQLRYMLVASPDFARRFFPRGLNKESVARAPLVHSDRNDPLQDRVLKKLIGEGLNFGPAHYAPSTESYLKLVLAGLAYGLVTEIQAQSHIDNGSLVEIDKRGRLDLPLFWHCRRKGPRILDVLGEAIVQAAP